MFSPRSSQCRGFEIRQQLDIAMKRISESGHWIASIGRDLGRKAAMSRKANSASQGDKDWRDCPRRFVA